jgi:hypothetical protein
VAEGVRRQGAQNAVDDYRRQLGEIVDTPAEPSAGGGAPPHRERGGRSYDDIIAAHADRFGGYPGRTVSRARPGPPNQAGFLMPKKRYRTCPQDPNSPRTFTDLMLEMKGPLVENYPKYSVSLSQFKRVHPSRDGFDGTPSASRSSATSSRAPRSRRSPARSPGRGTSGR